MGNSTEGPRGGVRMRFSDPLQRSVAPRGSPPKAPVAAFACVSPAHYSASSPQSSTECPRGE
eukprot:8207737-Pyramimonas_sp.AAC.1